MAILYFLLFLSVFIDTFKNSYFNHFGNNILKTNKDAIVFNIVCGIGSVLFFLFSGAGFKISNFSLILAIVFAIITAMAQLFSILALSTGPMSYSVLFTYLGMIIPTFYGMYVKKTPLTTGGIIGLILMVLTFYFSMSKDSNNQKGSFKWFVYAFISFVAWGLVGVVQFIHQSSEFRDEIKEFLLYSFIFMTIIFVIMNLFFKRGNEGYRIKSKSTIVVIISGIITGAINLINLGLSGKLPPIIVFPVLNGGVIVLSGLAALIIFKEKQTKKQIIGIICGIISIMVLGLS